jgi:chromosomal replication initiator protein
VLILEKMNSDAIKKIWESAFFHVKSRLGDDDAAWIAHLSFGNASESEIVAFTSSKLHRDRLAQRYSPLFESEIEKLTGKKYRLRIEVAPATHKPAEKQAEKSGQHADYTDAGPTGGGAGAADLVVAEAPYPAVFDGRFYGDSAGWSGERKGRHVQLNEKYTFDTYVVGENNNFAANAAVAISKNPGTTNYNPLFIYGGVGLGKTHLIHAVGNYTHTNSDKKIIYTTAEAFMNDFVESIKDGKMSLFKKKYRHVDVLLIDDIHFFEKKVQAQEELFNTFNALYSEKKQMMFTCDRPLSELRDISERLTSRLGSGLQVDIQMPPFETCCAILQKKCEEFGVTVPPDVIDLICRNISSNIRDLVAALKKLVGYADLLHKPVDIAIAQQQLRDVFSSSKQSNISFDIITRVVAEYFSLSPNDLRGKKKSQNIVYPRQLAMYIIHEITEYSTTEIGQAFGNRDHTTVLHSLDKIEKKKIADPGMDSLIQNLVRQSKEASVK